MELRHSFTIPVGLEETWAHFQDISGVAECFPGAKVTSAEGDDFTGTAKVKLGPVALQYSGSGTFLERDEAGRRMVFEAKGKDKRGNGTAGALVTLTFAEAADGTRADVVTDLSVTGKPAQFGSRMLQEVSDKLLGQFVDCLQQRVGTTGTGTAAQSAAAASGVSADDVAVDAAGAEAAAAPPAASGGEPTRAEGAEPTTPAHVPRSGVTNPSTAAPPTPAPTPGSGTVTAARRSSPSPAGSAEPGDDALDLGATVLPVIARVYGKQAGVGLLVLLVLWLVGRRLSR